MKFPKSYDCYLEFTPGGKGVPYNGGDPRSDGETNHGFRSLKGRTDQVSQIPEVHDDPALARFLTLVNASETAFFTVGCVSGKVADEHGFRMSGYVEFCINDKVLAADAVNYFKLFWHFSQALSAARFAERVALHWQLLGALFLEARTDGMTCPVIINTHYHNSEESAYSCWANTLDFLATCLVEQSGSRLDRIY
ncbi:MAG: hypothetical protein KF715_15940 [Candidatus Didemnitutus sp.]|nr:hypothetical protein [Candidatus Didemnitutus sp.]